MDDLICERCLEEDESVMHILCDCDSFVTWASFLWSQVTIMSKVLQFIRGVGWYDMVWFSGVGFPMHCDLYVVYCTSPLNFKSAAIPSQRNGAARPTYQRTAEPSVGGIGNHVLGREMAGNFAQRPLWGLRFFYVQ
jgi:hypothetical protein